MARAVPRWALMMLVAHAWPLAAAAAEPLPVVTGAGDQTAPSVSAGMLAYADDAGGPRQVRVMELATGAVTNRSVGLVVRGAPVLDQGILAFTTPGEIRIVSFDDPALSAAFPAPSADAVSASTLLVAWEQAGRGGRDVALFPLGSGRAQVLDGAGDEHGPSVSYGWVAWLDDAGAGAVRLRDPLGAVTTPFPAAAREVSLWGSSRSATPLLAVVVDGPAGGAELLVVEASGAVRGRLSRPAGVKRPRLGNEWVAFEDLATGTSQVTLWQWTTGRVVVPAPTGREQLLNDLRIEGKVMRLAWADGRGGDLDIYLFEATLPLPDLPPGQARCDDPLAPVLADVLVRRSPGPPSTGRAVISLPEARPVLACLDAEDVCAAWAGIGTHPLASPADFRGPGCGRDDDDRDEDDRGKDDRGKDDRGKDDRGKDDRGKDDRGKDDRGKDDRGKDDRGKDDRGKDGHPDGSHGCPKPAPVRIHLESKLELPLGDSMVWVRLASARGATLRVRVLADGWQNPLRVACVAGVDCPEPSAPPSARAPGCSSGGVAGLLGLAVIPLVLGRARRRRTM